MKTKHNIQPPDWLTDEAKKVFNETVETLATTVLPSDSSAIADFSQALADCAQWSKEVRFEGETVPSAIGNWYTNPKYTNLMARRKDLERYRDALGLTPKARKAPVSSTPRNGLKDLMKR